MPVGTSPVEYALKNETLFAAAAGVAGSATIQLSARLIAATTRTIPQAVRFEMRPIFMKILRAVLLSSAYSSDNILVIPQRAKFPPLGFPSGRFAGPFSCALELLF